VGSGDSQEMSDLSILDMGELMGEQLGYNPPNKEGRHSARWQGRNGIIAYHRKSLVLAVSPTFQVIAVGVARVAPSDLQTRPRYTRFTNTSPHFRHIVKELQVQLKCLITMMFFIDVLPY
jgi:hypothetical protein